MSPDQKKGEWREAITPPIAEGGRMDHVRFCSLFAAGQMGRHPEWADTLDTDQPPTAAGLSAEIAEFGLDPGLRRYRNRQMLRIIWRDLCGLSLLGETFADLTGLAEICLQASVDEHTAVLRDKHGVPRDAGGVEQRIVVLGLGKMGGVELNLSSDIDVMFCYPEGGSCDGRRNIPNEQFFIRLARAVIASLTDVTEDGFCFRVDARLRPFGNAGPLCISFAAMEQYYQREGRDWERYALIKARAVAGDIASGNTLLHELLPFVYRRYIDFGAVEALQEMHAGVRDDARRKGREDDIKRGPGGIREIEFLTQCFQLLRGGREAGLQTPSLYRALEQIEALGLLPPETIAEAREDYVYLRTLENRIQAQRDQQTHLLPAGEDLERLVRAMHIPDVDSLHDALARCRERVSSRFEAIFPKLPEPSSHPEWVDMWRTLQTDRQDASPESEAGADGPMAVFLRRLERYSVSERARRRLDQFMPLLLHRLDNRALDDKTLNRVFDLVLAISRRSAYLILLVQNAPALDRMLDLFDRSEWIAQKVTRFPALLDELIDPSLGRQIPSDEQLAQSVRRLLKTSPHAEATLEGLNHLKLATSLRVAVAQLKGSIPAEEAQLALSALAEAVIGGVLQLAAQEIVSRHGRLPGADLPGTPDQVGGLGLAVIAYGTLGAREMGYDSDLDLIFLFRDVEGFSDGKRALNAERYFARICQRVLSFMTVMTPSGRLYAVDTRLRPNGKSGSLVSSVAAFHRYQLNEAWTWELQALTRARFAAGSPEVGATFGVIRKEVLSATRECGEVRKELAEMRDKMRTEHSSGDPEDSRRAAKHSRGGLIDIEFIAQLGVLTQAPVHPATLEATGTLGQLRALSGCAWLEAADAAVLKETMSELRRLRMMAELTPGADLPPVDTSASTMVYDRLLGLALDVY
jgi:glutamate-ammonia-ligase adenylyltransferase